MVYFFFIFVIRIKRLKSNEIKFKSNLFSKYDLNKQLPHFIDLQSNKL